MFDKSSYARDFFILKRCYVGKRNLESAIRQLSDDAVFHVSWKPFFLNDSTPDNGYPLLDYLSKKFGPQAAQQAKDGTGHLSRAGQDVGIKFNYTRKVVNTLKSHCLLDFATTVGCQNDVAEKLFHVYFEDAQDINSNDVIINVAKETGLDVDAVMKHISDDGVRSRVKREGFMAKQNDVTGVPYFSVYTPGNEADAVSFSGAQPVQTFISIFRKLLLKR